MSTPEFADPAKPGAIAGVAPPSPGAANAPRRATLRAQLNWLVLALALPLIAYQAWDIYDRAQAQARHAREVVFALAQITASETAKFLGQAQNILKGLAARPAVRALDTARCDPLLQDFLSLAPRFANLITVTLDGQVVCSALPSAQPIRITPGRLTQQLRGGAPFAVGEAVRGAVSGRWAVPLGVPLLDAQGGIAGSVNLAIDLANIPLLPLVEGLSANTVFGLIDADGTVLARSVTPERFVGTNQREHAATNVVLREKGGTHEGIGLDGVQRIRGFAPVPGTGWIAIASVPTSEVYAGLGARIVRSALLGVVILAAALLLAWRLVRQIREPIAALADTAGEVAAGKLAARAPVAGAAEIAQVATQFNRMLDARTAAEVELRKAKVRFEKIFHAAPLAAAISTLKDGRLVEVNDAYCELTGRAREALIGRTALEIGTWDTPQRDAFVERLRAEHRVQGMEGHIRTAAGESRQVLTSAELIDFFDEPCMMLIGLDITERVLAQQKIGRQLDELNRWYQATLGREDRVQELKREVNELRARLGEATRYVLSQDGMSAPESAPDPVAGSAG